MIKHVAVQIDSSIATFVEIDGNGKYKVVKQFCKFYGNKALLLRAIAALNHGDDEVEVVRGSRVYSPIRVIVQSDW